MLMNGNTRHAPKLRTGRGSWVSSLNHRSRRDNLMGSDSVYTREMRIVASFSPDARKSSRCFRDSVFVSVMWRHPDESKKTKTRSDRTQQSRAGCIKAIED